MNIRTGSACALFLMSALILGSIQLESKAYEPKYGEWRVVFGGFQKTEKVKITVKANGTSSYFTGTAGNLGLIFRALSGKFQPAAQKLVNNKHSHFILLEPVEITIRKEGKQLKQLRAKQADIQYEKVG